MADLWLIDMHQQIWSSYWSYWSYGANEIKLGEDPVLDEVRELGESQVLGED
jgi:hypothetical protein